MPDPAGVLEHMQTEGYIRVPEVLPEGSVTAMRACVERLYELDIPLPFAFVFDEPWDLFRSARLFVETLVGGEYYMLPAFWVWYVPPSDEAAGWGPHRDKAQVTVDEHNTPMSLTVWLAFSDATTLNGCIHVLPLRHDDRFALRVFAGQGSSMVFEPQGIRALPAPAGALMAWNQNLLHWGGRASHLATGPRCSAAFEFQRADTFPMRMPPIPAEIRPDFRERVGLIAMQILQYQHMYPLSPDAAAVATSLFERFQADLKQAVEEQEASESAT